MKKHLLSLLAVSSAISAFAQLPVSTSQENRKVVLEEFTGYTCQYCPDGHKKADQLVAANPANNFVINIHVGGYSTPASGQPDYRTPFGTSIVNQTQLAGYPAGTINRHLFTAYSQNTTTPGTAMSRGYWTSAAGQIESLPSIVNVAFQATIDAQTRLLTVDCEAYYTGTSTVSTNYFNLALVQDSLVSSQTGGATWYPAMMVGSLYQHNKMLRHMVTGQWGDPITNPTMGSTYAKTFTYTIPAQLPLTVSGGAIKTNVLLSKLRLIAFVTESQQEILSGNKGPITIVNSSPTGISSYDPSEEYSVNLFPNPTSGNATVAMLLSKHENVSVKLYNMLGAEVSSQTAELDKGFQSLHIDGSNLPAGVYFVRVNVGNKVTTEKLTISK